MALPMPLPAPVTNATLSLNRIIPPLAADRSMRSVWSHTNRPPRHDCQPPINYRWPFSSLPGDGENPPVLPRSESAQASPDSLPLSIASARHGHPQTKDSPLDYDDLPVCRTTCPANK